MQESSVQPTAAATATETATNPNITQPAGVSADAKLTQSAEFL